MKKGRKWILVIPAALLAVVILILLANPYAVHVVWCNWTAGKVPMDTSNQWDGGETYLRVQYSNVSQTDYLDLYVPDTEEPAPLFVLIHGGGFIAGDSQTRQAQLMYRYFRDHGYACATINYRLAQEAPFPGAVQDCKAAIRFLRANAETFGYNADRIAVFGESAGGYLAMMCGVTSDDEFNDLPFIGEDKAGTVSAKVDVVVNYYGAMSFQTMQEELKQLNIPQIVYDIGNSWITGEVLQGYEDLESFWSRKNLSEMTAEELATLNPYTYINRNLNENSDLSVWIIHGDCDITVPYLQSQKLHARLTELMGQENVSYRLVPNMGHASDPLYSNSELALLEQFLNERMKK